MHTTAKKINDKDRIDKCFIDKWGAKPTVEWSANC